MKYNITFSSLKKSIASIGLLLMVIICSTNVTLYALSSSFNQNLVLSDSDISVLPAHLSSSALIQAYLDSQGSLLANLRVRVSFEPDDVLINPNYFSTLPAYLVPRQSLASVYNQDILVSDLVWRLSRGDEGSGCSLSDYSICANNRTSPINPAFILALIQKEHGMVYGSQARRSLSDSNVQFQLDRVVGYYCTENPDPSKSCYDQNPDWKYYKGFFRQIYYATRLLRLYQQRCDKNGNVVGGINYHTGNTYSFSGSNVTFQNGITCALYIYTPNIGDKNTLYSVMKDLRADQNVIQSVPTNEVLFRTLPE